MRSRFAATTKAASGGLPLLSLGGLRPPRGNGGKRPVKMSEAGVAHARSQGKHRLPGQHGRLLLSATLELRHVQWRVEQAKLVVAVAAYVLTWPPGVHIAGRRLLRNYHLLALFAALVASVRGERRNLHSLAFGRDRVKTSKSFSSQSRAMRKEVCRSGGR
jgi:hypothetical protein